MKIDAIVESPFVGNDSTINVPVDIDYVEGTEEAVKEWVESWLEQHYTADKINYGGYAITNLDDIVEDLKLDLQVVGLASMFQIYFNPEPVLNYEIAQKSDTKRFLVYFRELLKNGVFIPPSQFECNFISGAHTEDDLVKTSEAIEAALKVAWEK